MTKEKDDDKTDEARMFKEESGKGSFTPPPSPPNPTNLTKFQMTKSIPFRGDS